MMRRKIMLAATALALTAGSIFAVSAAGTEKSTAKVAAEQCPPECCNGNGGDCGPESCCE
jgi:hypothetical protein